MALSPDQAARLSLEAQQRILELKAWNGAREVLLYVDFRNEVGTGLLLEDALRSGKRVLLPRCRSDCPGEMDLAYVTGPEDVIPGMFGIGEPNPATCSAAKSCAPEAAVLPGVAFDRRGFRLGYGGGYYDRLLADADGLLAGTLLIGLAYSFQVVEELPRETWDKPVHCVCSEDFVLWP